MSWLTLSLLLVCFIRHILDGAILRFDLLLKVANLLCTLNVDDIVDEHLIRFGVATVASLNLPFVSRIECRMI